jgi:hypothetical protein
VGEKSLPATHGTKYEKLAYTHSSKKRKTPKDPSTQYMGK